MSWALTCTRCEVTWHGKTDDEECWCCGDSDRVMQWRDYACTTAEERLLAQAEARKPVPTLSYGAQAMWGQKK